jgi:hypothetical protein
MNFTLRLMEILKINNNKSLTSDERHDMTIQNSRTLKLSYCL